MSQQHSTSEKPAVTLCPRCKISMDYYIERERLGNGSRRITMYYKCPACNTVIVDERISITIGPEGASVEIRKDGSLIGKSRRNKRGRRNRNSSRKH